MTLKVTLRAYTTWGTVMWGDGWNGVCGAKTREGTPCKCLALDNGRCKYHGGMSTGPRTPQGKKRALMNLKQYIEGVDK